MTLNELKKEVLALMFESEIDQYEAFVFAVNRALAEIHGELARREVAKIRKEKLEANEYYARLSHEGGNDFAITLNGKAFSFTVSGAGSVTVYDGSGSESISFSSAKREVKRKIKSEKALLIFKGSADYEIYDVASFKSSFGEKDEDVPLYSSLAKYDMREIDPRFLSLTSGITDGEGRSVLGLKIEGSLIYLPREYEGELIIYYKRMPKKIGTDELDAVIDVYPECEHLLALRCAAYLLLDGNEGLSEYYLSLYKSGMNAIRGAEGRGAGEKFLDVLGWA